MEMRNENRLSATADPGCDSCATRQQCLFARAASANNNSIKLHLRERAVGVGELIEKQGDLANFIGVVKVGLLKGLRSNAQNISKPIALFGRGRVVGLSSAYRLPSRLTLVAVTPMRLCEVGSETFERHTLMQGGLQELLLRSAASKVDCLTDWARLLREESHLQRLCNALRLIAVEEGSQAFRIPSHSDLADLLGSRRETIARNLSTLIRRGFFRKTGRWHGVLTRPQCEVQGIESETD
ncbi:Crp/Fnr family transcriptional regulator [Hydrogenophaga sp.]|uniref:Crp/Fnr family transcriptional regulator n=1 Tax=Hydrogenophaga sp. TaxID=1904254 RepID=UPI0025BEBA56|nr:Crp/Fnr family transcriptional regulator [Hydrogenophaga sp.]